MKLIYCRPEFLHGIRAIVGFYSPPKIVLQVRHQDWEPSTDSRDRFSKAMDSQKTILTPFNFFEWKEEMEILLREKCLYRVNMATEAEPNAAAAGDVRAAIGVAAMDDVVVVVGAIAAIAIWVQWCLMRPCTSPQSHFVSVVVTMRGKEPSWWDQQTNQGPHSTMGRLVCCQP